jgi:hypothetical protein
VYVLVRRDLPPSQQAVQACHAAIEVARNWISQDLEHPSVIVCGIRDEQILEKSLKKLQSQGVQCKTFHEPDRGNELTAIATEPIYGDRRKLFRSYQLLQPCPVEGTRTLGDQT